MNQKVFDTKQKAEELLREALSIWKQGNHGETLESLQDDPVFKLLISAVAYQSNQTENDLEWFKEQVLEEFTSLLTPYDTGHATPASVIIQTAPAGSVGETILDSSDVFTSNEGNLSFIPMLRTKVMAAQISSLKRMSGRNWELTLSLERPTSDFSGFAFAVKDCRFKDLHIYVEGKELPLVRPWEYSELPFSNCFSLEHENYNGTTIFDPSMSILDLFARHDIRLYTIRKYQIEDFFPQEVVSLKVEVEFEGITPDFTFDPDKLFLNSTFLVNANVGEVTLDAAHPIACVSGNSDNGYKLVQVLRPGRDQIYSDAAVRVRRVAADRFNQASLVKLLSTLLSKAHTDYYAFADLDIWKSKELLSELSVLLKKMINLTNSSNGAKTGGTYVMLDNPFDDNDVSVGLKYITTPGADSAKYLNEKTTFSVPHTLDSAATRQIARPEQGTDDVVDKEAYSEQVQYFVQTGNRLVTPSDIRKYCLKELVGRYGITPYAVKDIKIGPRLCKNTIDKANACGYEIAVDIVLSDTPFVRRSLADKIPQIELLLEKMMQVRSVNVYPIKVSIEIR